MLLNLPARLGTGRKFCISSREGWPEPGLSLHGERHSALDVSDPRPIDLRASSRGGWLWITYPTYIVHAITYNAAAVPREVTSRFVALMRRRASRCHSRKRSPARRRCQCFSSAGCVPSPASSRRSSLLRRDIDNNRSLRGSFAGARDSN